MGQGKQKAGDRRSARGPLTEQETPEQILRGRGRGTCRHMKENNLGRGKS